MYIQEDLERVTGEWYYGGGPGHPRTELTSRAERSEDRDPILGLRPCRTLNTARSRRKGPPRVPRPARGLPRFHWVAPQRLAAQQYW
ncbi:hypothetical protein NDU88_003487 [Pleurodeles waltl]|uniref:Uncharacterized protein n=1 Tax=Pleurodeles waltl TaxID=8319 RepID=A0AAV7UDG3_PLEWA|nr:hypothetical protein NDU88_003487 [Pleurodeles waltl]